MNTLLLDTVEWDLLLDASGNIALARAPYALAQDVASAIKLFAGELWYDASQGIPYFEQILGHAPPLTLFQEYMVAAALTVPEVTNADCVLDSFKDRGVTGQVLFTDEAGNTQVVAIT